MWADFQRNNPELKQFPTEGDLEEDYIKKAEPNMPRELYIANGILGQIPILAAYHKSVNDQRDLLIRQNPKLGVIGLTRGWISSVRKDTLPGVAGAFGTPTP